MQTGFYLGAVGLPLYFLVMAAIEGAVLSRFQEYNWKSFGGSALNMIVRHGMLVVIPFSITASFSAFLIDHSLLKISIGTWPAFFCLFLGHEFFHYWYHRSVHRIRWFWIGHSVHHSPNELNFSVSCRAELFQKFTGVKIFFFPLLWLGFPPLAILLAASAGFFYQLWVHTTWIPKLGWLEYVFNTPSAHRVHHASNPEYLDANFGSVLIVFDRLFGTYVAEREDVPCRYGLVKPQPSNNPLRFEFEPWIALGRDLYSSRSVREFFGYLFLPPGWKPDGAGNTTREFGQQRVLVPVRADRADPPG